MPFSPTALVQQQARIASPPRRSNHCCYGAHCFSYFCQERLLQMKRNLPSMSSLTSEEMGLEDEADVAAVSSESKSKQVKQKAAPKKLR